MVGWLMCNGWLTVMMFCFRQCSDPGNITRQAAGPQASLQEPHQHSSSIRFILYSLLLSHLLCSSHFSQLWVLHLPPLPPLPPSPHPDQPHHLHLHHCPRISREVLQYLPSPAPDPPSQVAQMLRDYFGLLHCYQYLQVCLQIGYRITLCSFLQVFRIHFRQVYPSRERQPQW